ncbi:glycoside hydrolase family 43 protein [Persicobacter psychrovividus]|uniref:Glycoside hydrolase 43 family protein n=1 Tax=Persicobacter psychrovividus TaxID=387638 RepID=A0ABM7VMT4_9BACT|nr:glycoside hydrolase 43 family protein [Persicobacter psychrovividus]
MKLSVLLWGIYFFFTLSVSAQEAPKEFTNPILSGFYPDPSICRVGDTYYMVNSSFEWFPGLPIHKSNDLVNWQLIGYGLSRPTQVEYKDDLQNSKGIFAPTIRYHNGKFYIITTMVGGKGNFIITSDNPEKGWSDPLWIKDAPGIDPSLFWDDDGICYYTGAGIVDGSEGEWPGKNGVWMQQIDPDKGVLLGEKKQLTYGHASNARWAEGPHIYKINGEYLLMLSEGGTNEYHAISVFNSKNILGPYIPNHANPVLTHRHLGENYPIVQTGHADLVQTQNGEWWSVMLAKRKVDGFCTLSRETFLAKVEMTVQESGVTPIFNPKKGLLQSHQPRPNLPYSPVVKQKGVDTFDSPLGLQWNFLKSPKYKWYETKNGHLEISLRKESLIELCNPSFIAQRVKHHDFIAEVKLNFTTDKSNEMAGISVYRMTGNNYQLMKTDNSIILYKVHNQNVNTPNTLQLIAEIPYNSNSVILRLDVTGNIIKFFYGETTKNMVELSTGQDYTILSDEATKRFNGVYVGMYATSQGEESSNQATFKWFNYKVKSNQNIN